MNILWCITGAGEYLKESIEVMSRLEHAKITIFLSKAGEEVLRNYGLFRSLKKAWHTEREKGHSATKAGKVSLKAYDIVVVSPATANTVAKLANGIADNLVTTAVSMALKGGVPVYLVPSDWAPKKVKIPKVLIDHNTTVHMKPRKSDLRNIRYLEEEGIRVLESPDKILKELR